MKGIKPYRGPKPHIGPSENPKKFARGMDPVSAVKKLFLYKDIFGNMGGAPKGMGKMKGGLGGAVGGLGGGGGGDDGGGVGNIGIIVAARRMGLI